VTLVVETAGLTKRYGRTTALDGLDLTLEPGEVVGYLGPNGAGKSTTISLLLGLVRPSGGSARLFGLDARRDAARIHRRLAYVPSTADLWPALTAEETLRFLAAVHGSVDRHHLDALVDRFELPLDRKVRTLSHGNKQKVPLVAAFAARPELLLLDEPTTGLDPLMEQAFRECVREARDRGATVFLSSHVLSEVEAVCDRVVMLRAGRVVESGSLEVLRALSATHVRVRFAGPVPDLRGVVGTSGVVVRGDTLECDVTGSMEPLVAALAGARVEHLATLQPSLEELFLVHYGDGAEAAPPTRPARVGA
jgi:ABC-2 type transport system ATP-binding protein